MGYQYCLNKIYVLDKIVGVTPYFHGEFVFKVISV